MAARDGGGEAPRHSRRRSVDSPRAAEKAAASGGEAGGGGWLTEELVAVGELKRGAIAAQFPEEFSVDSDFLNGASNVWLPARLHPEIAPGEFQEWLKKHGSQLSKVEDTVNRRKSILSYSYDGAGSDSGEEAGPAKAVAISVRPSAALRRRNTTGLVRRKTFTERVEEEEEAAGGDGATSFLVQHIQRSSLKRSKLANKRRDSTASTGSARRRGRGRSRAQAHDASAPAVSSPLAPLEEPEPADDPAEGAFAAGSYAAAGTQPYHAAQPHGGGSGSGVPAGRVPPATATAAGPDDSHGLAPGHRLSTVEILKQVTAAVDDISFNDFELCGLDSSDGDPAARRQQPVPQPQPLSPPQPQQPPLPPKQQHQQYSAAPAQAAAPTAPERKTVAHKKSSSWWQWGRDDSGPAPAAGAAQTGPGADWGAQPAAAAADGRPARHGEQAQHQPGGADDAAPTPSSSLKAKLPSSMSFLRFSRKGKKDRKMSADDSSKAGPSRGAAPPVPGVPPAQQPPPPPPPPPQQAAQRAVTPQQQKQQRYPQAAGQKSEADSDSDSTSDSESSLRLPPTLQPGSGSEGSGSGSGTGSQQPQQQQHSHIPSIITPVRPPPTRLATGSNRLPIHIERAIYRLGSIKLTNPRRPLLQQVLLSNMLFWYLELINPTSQQRQQQQQQQQQQQPQPQPQPQPQQQAPRQQPLQQQPQPQPQQSPQRSDQRQNYNRQPQQPQQPQQQQQPQGDGGAAGRRGKRGGPLNKSRDQDGRRRSAGTSAGEQVVMRSPQYERQQQQIYMNGSGGSAGGAQGYVYSQQSPPTSPQSMQLQHQGQQHKQHQNQHMPYQHAAAARSQPSVARQSHSDEDDDVPLALYRGERNAMSIG